MPMKTKSRSVECVCQTEFRKSNVLNVPYYRESNRINCAPASARMVLAYYGIEKSEQELDIAMETTKNQGTTPRKFIEGMQKLGIKVDFFHKLPLLESWEKLRQILQNKIPAIVSLNMVAYKKQVQPVGANVQWQGSGYIFHYVVVIGIDEKHVYFLDCAEKDKQHGRIKLPIPNFLTAWYNDFLFGDTFVLSRN